MHFLHLVNKVVPSEKKYKKIDTEAKKQYNICIRQWRKNGVENLTDLQGKKANTTQVIIRDFLLAKEWN